MSLKSILGSIAVAVALVPSVVGAQALINLGSGSSLRSVFIEVLNIINVYVIPFIIAIAVIYFLIGVLQFIMNADQDEKRTAGRNKIIYGLIGLAVMLSLWGLVAFVQRSFGLGNGGGPGLLPNVPVVTGSSNNTNQNYTGGTKLNGGVGQVPPQQ